MTRKLQHKDYSVRIAHGMTVYVGSRTDAESEAMRIEQTHPMLSVWVCPASKKNENKSIYA